MSKKVLIIAFTILVIALKSNFAQIVDYNYIINYESSYIDSCVVPSGAIVMGRNFLYTFQGTPHYKICPDFSHLAANALLDNPTPHNLAIVKNWMTWVFNHLNSDGSIYDYFVDKLDGGIEHRSIDAYARDGYIPDYDSKDGYAADFLILARRYAEVVPSDRIWLRGYSDKLELVGQAIYSVVDDSNHYFDQFSPDNNDGLTVAKTDYQVKYTMDNAAVNEGLRAMVWLQQNVIADGNPSFYQNLLDNNTKGFANLWDSTVSMYYPYEGSPSPNWNTFYANATCQLSLILNDMLSLSSPRATGLYNTFNSYYSEWQNGKQYGGYPWVLICYVAALMNDTARVNTYLSYVQELLDKGQNPPNWFIAEAAFTLRAAKRMTVLTDLKETVQQIPQSYSLEQNYPNPFNSTTKIQYFIKKPGMVSLRIYNILGWQIAVLVNQYQEKGKYTVNFNASNLTNGIYIYVLKTGSFQSMKKMLLIK